MRRQTLFGMVSALVGLLGCSLFAQPAGQAAGTREGAPRKKVVADLPLPERYAISAALGRDQQSYHVRSTAAGHGFHNRPQDLITWFRSGGLEVETGRAKVTLRLVAMGFTGAVSPVPPAGKTVDRANRIEVPRAGIVEWYVNGPLGLQQGFTLHHAPEAGDDSRINLILAIESNFDVYADAAGTGLVFRGANGESVLRYGGLTAFDADGRTLAARIGFGNGRARIRVETDGARFPIVIDPLFQSAKLLASDGRTAHYFGYVSISGETVVVGAPGARDYGTDSGAAYVFVRPSMGWGGKPAQSAKLLASDGAAGDVFGWSTSVSGDTIVVGARFDDGGAGRAYVFVKPVGGWSGKLLESAKLVASDRAGGHRFGESVSISGNTVVVGAPYGNGIRNRSGAAYIFVEPPAGWSGQRTESAKLFASDGAGMDQLGIAVAVSGDAAVAGAWWNDVGGVDSGSAYVFVKPSMGWSGTRNHTAKLVASDGTRGDFFGRAVAMHGDTVVAGAYADSDNGGSSGSAYVYVKPAGGWKGTLTEGAKLLASDGAAKDQFGWSVAVSDEKVVVGAYADDDKGIDSGSAYVFVRPAVGWTGKRTETAKLLASDGVAGDSFGMRVGVDGANVVAGASGDDDNGAGSGSAHMFVLVGLTGAGAPRPGGTVTLSLEAVTDAGLPYQLGSSLGTVPIRLGKRVLRLSPDDLLVITTGNRWPTIFVGYRGTLDSSGRAAARINIPKIPALVGQKIYSAFVTLGPGAPFGIKSIADPYLLMITQ